MLVELKQLHQITLVTSISTHANFNGQYPYNGGIKGFNAGKTLEVGSFPTNDWGFHDMLGNVREWCSDWYGEYPSGSTTNPLGSTNGSERIERGGGWASHGWGVRSANRVKRHPDIARNDLGFRLCLRPDKGMKTLQGKQTSVITD